MKLKKLAAAGLAAVMCVTAVGCGGNGEPVIKRKKIHRRRRKRNPVIILTQKIW